jgi:hypothetical protein
VDAPLASRSTSSSLSSLYLLPPDSGLPLPPHQSPAFSKPTTWPFTSPLRKMASAARPSATEPPAIPLRVHFECPIFDPSKKPPQTLPSALSWNAAAGVWCSAPASQPRYALPPPLLATPLASSPSTSLPKPCGPAVLCHSFPLGKVDYATIQQLIGRWCSDQILRYLHVSARPIMQCHARIMTENTAFRHFPTPAIDLVD